MEGTRGWNVERGGWGPAVARGIVASARVQVTVEGSIPAVPPPYDHEASGPDSHMLGSPDGSPHRGHRLPGVRLRIVAAAGVENPAVTLTSPDDHLAPRPDRSGT